MRLKILIGVIKKRLKKLEVKIELKIKNMELIRV